MNNRLLVEALANSAESARAMDMRLWQAELTQLGANANFSGGKLSVAQMILLATFSATFRARFLNSAETRRIDDLVQALNERLNQAYVKNPHVNLILKTIGRNP